MTHLLDNYIIDARTRYEAHKLIYTPENDEPVLLGGILAASILAALIVDTDEGDTRNIALDTDEQRTDFFIRYEREVRRDDWGYLAAEIAQLRENYIQIEVGPTTLTDLCPNLRLFNLASDLTVAYMQHLVLKTFKEHIWDAVHWRTPFPQWLIDAARVETRRQRFLKTDWTDAPAVDMLADEQSSISDFLSSTEPPTFFFEGEKAEDIMERYLQWLSDEYVAMKQELPGAKITSADRKYIFAQETDCTFVSDDINRLEASEQKEKNLYHCL